MHHVDVRDLGGDHDRDTDRAEGHRGSIGDETYSSGVHRVEAKANEHRCRYGNRCAKTRRSLDERSECKSNEQGLEAPVIGDTCQGISNFIELP